MCVSSSLIYLTTCLILMSERQLGMHDRLQRCEMQPAAKGRIQPLESLPSHYRSDG